MNKVYLLLGGNLGDRKKNINAAIHLIKKVLEKYPAFLRFIKLPHGEI